MVARTIQCKCGAYEVEEYKDGLCIDCWPYAPRVERTDLEPPGGNLYRPHYLQIDSGTFWRCAHGFTGISTSDTHIPICWECAVEEPGRAIVWHGEDKISKEAIENYKAKKMLTPQLIELQRDLHMVECQNQTTHPDPDYGKVECCDRMPYTPESWCPLCRAVNRLNEIIEGTS